MRYILAVLIILSPKATATSWGDRVRSFCEKHLIADSTWWEDEQYTIMLQRIHEQSADEQDYAVRLIARFREEGGKLQWLLAKRNTDLSDRALISHHRTAMRAIKFELDRSPLADAITDAILDYGYLLRKP